MGCGTSVSLIEQTGKSDDPFCRGVGQRNGRVYLPGGGLDLGALTVAISCRLRVVRTMSRPLARDAYRKVRSFRGNGEWSVAVSVFSGLTNLACALARVAAMAPIRVDVHSHDGISPANFRLVMPLKNRLNRRLETDTTHDGPTMIILNVAELGKEP
jgi:hypothetical protein